MHWTQVLDTSTVTSDNILWCQSSNDADQPYEIYVLVLQISCQVAHGNRCLALCLFGRTKVVLSTSLALLNMFYHAKLLPANPAQEK